MVGAVVGEEDDATGRVEEGLARKACRAFPLVMYEFTSLRLWRLDMSTQNSLRHKHGVRRLADSCKLRIIYVHFQELGLKKEFEGDRGKTNKPILQILCRNNKAKRKATASFIYRGHRKYLAHLTINYIDKM